MKIKASKTAKRRRHTDGQDHLKVFIKVDQDRSSTGDTDCNSARIKTGGGIRDAE